ncbi:hypothetical protein VQH23_12470 [Pararoseomonas sp. SCSIO 73927]|uniref:hypothetical protein n=1 Tax=Pararoseomonas sp. SCSIO 73927 TaxID=3114537 RepID=UPI0030D62287
MTLAKRDAAAPVDTGELDDNLLRHIRRVRHPEASSISFPVAGLGLCTARWQGHKVEEVLVPYREAA